MNCGKFLRLLTITGLACGLWSGNGSVERASVLEQHPVAIDGKLYRDRGLELVRTDAFLYSPYQRADMLGDARATANFIVNYSGFTPQAQVAFQYHGKHLGRHRRVRCSDPSGRVICCDRRQYPRAGGL